MLRKITFFGLVHLLLLLVQVMQVASAQTRYVTDDFEVMLRTGPSIQNKIIRPMGSGTRIEVLREDSGNGHSQVQTSNGEIGYVLTRFLSTNPSARNRVRYLERQLKELRSEPDQIRTLLANSQEQNQEIISQNTSLTDRLKTVVTELKEIKVVSADAVNIARKNQRLEGEVQQLLLQLDDIRIQNEDLKDQSDRLNTLFGGGLILLGLFLGWVLSISGRRSRNSWGS